MKTLNIVTRLSLVVAIFVASPAAWSAERMKSGKWEMTNSGGGSSRASSACVTPQSANDVNGTPAEVRTYVEKTAAATNCTVQDFKVQGDTISYSMTCRGVPMESTTKYHGDAYEMTMFSKGAETGRVTAKWVGAC